MPVEPLRPGIVYRSPPLSPLTVAKELDDLRYDVDEMTPTFEVLQSVKRLVNRWGVVILSAAVTAGLFNGTTGKFLSALLAAVHG